jgi:hypothetical protein
VRGSLPSRLMSTSLVKCISSRAALAADECCTESLLSTTQQLDELLAKAVAQFLSAVLTCRSAAKGEPDAVAEHAMKPEQVLILIQACLLLWNCVAFRTRPVTALHVCHAQ